MSFEASETRGEVHEDFLCRISVGGGFSKWSWAKGFAWMIELCTLLLVGASSGIGERMNIL